jgi:hypothetical protein
MNKKHIGAAVLATLSISASIEAHATLASYAILQFTNGVTGTVCSGLYCSSSYSTVTSGSYFSIDFNGNGIFADNERTAMTANYGVMINASQSASGSHSGISNGTEITSIDSPFLFYANTGMHQTTSPVTIVSDNGTGHVLLNFSGWGVTWNGIPNIPLGGDVTQGDTGLASLVCGTNCAFGDTFSLTYTAHVPVGDISGFGGIYYGLHLEGMIGPAPLPTPIPAAIWLFGTGLIGLFGIAKRRSI